MTSTPTTTDDEDPLLTPKEVAKLFRVDPKTVTRWAAAGRLPSITTPGGHHRFRTSTVREQLSLKTAQRQLHQRLTDRTTRA